MSKEETIHLDSTDQKIMQDALRKSVKVVSRAEKQTLVMRKAKDEVCGSVASYEVNSVPTGTEMKKAEQEHTLIRK